MDVDTNTLRWFQQVADGTTVTEVSEVEAVTQSGVSRALQRLEAELGTPLLRRSGRVLRLTRAGAVFKRHVDALLHQLDDGIAAVTNESSPTPARLPWPSSTRWAPGSSRTSCAASELLTRESVSS